MIKIIIPNNFLPERKYIINVIFDEFFGLKYSISISNTKNYNIYLENGNKIVIRDAFFTNMGNGLDYLDKKNIPREIIFFKNQFIVEKDIPVIYGNNEFTIKEKRIICGIDIFASSFFMLTRWEEYVNLTRDVHNRFPANESLAYRNNFLKRPVVNEYIEMLWNMLEYLGCNQKRKEKKYELVLTHDVDNIFKWKTFNMFVKNIAGDIIKRKNIPLALNKMKEYFIKNPYDMFDYLMDLSEEIGIKSHFFFMSGGTSHFDNNYSIKQPFIRKIRRKIENREHRIGFHPSYNTYNNKNQWGKEYDDLSTQTLQEIKTGRQHFLRFEIPTTWQIWEENNMEWDSSLTYPEEEGFRCGICYEYSVFNILTRKNLKLKEIPLILMEVSMVNYQKLSTQLMQAKVNKLIDNVKKYDGKFVLLWHNSNFNSEIWKKYQDIYEKILRYN